MWMKRRCRKAKNPRQVRGPFNPALFYRGSEPISASGRLGGPLPARDVAPRPAPRARRRIRGAATYVAEHSRPHERGYATSYIQTTATLGFLLALLVIGLSRIYMDTRMFAEWGWRIPIWILHPSPFSASCSACAF